MLQPIPYTPTMRTEISTCSIGYLPPLFTRERATELKYSFDTQKQHYSLSRISISQGPQNRIVNTTTGLKATARGLLDADETGHTSRPGIFASGDVVNGARTVVEAVAHSKIVAESMHQYMQSLPKDSE